MVLLQAKKSFDFEAYKAMPLSAFQENIFYFEKIPLLIILILKHKMSKYSRTKDQVHLDYNEKVWKKFADEESWKKSKNLDDFIFPEFSNGVNRKTTMRYALMGNKLCKVSEFDYYRYRPQSLVTILKEFTRDNDEVVELGCGYGLNLFSLIALGLGFKNKMTGYDISENAIRSANAISKNFNCGIDFKRVDLTSDLDLIDLKNKTIISYYSFEQLKYHTTKLIDELINACPSQVIHIEPIAELYRKNIKDITSRLYIKSQDYQDNLLHTLRDFEKKDRVVITDIRRLGYAANPLHEASFIRWIPKFNKNK